LQNLPLTAGPFMPSRKSLKSPDMATWIDSRQSQGLYFFHRQDGLKTLQVTELAFKKAAARLSKKKRIARIHGGFFIIIPLEYAVTGILPAEWFIADLMDYIGQPFYVGLLSAAALHGAAHQQPQQFHVVTTGPMRDMRSNGLAIRFFSKSRFADVSLTQVKVQTGHIPISTPEATALDLIRYSRRIGGLDRVLTVLQELGEGMDPGNLAEAAKTDGKIAYAQRLGFLLEKAGFSDLTHKLFQWVYKKNPLPVKLERSMPTLGSKKDERWKILVNIDVEGDL
jgi:predicted transcriptional regulator of viral defense system